MLFSFLRHFVFDILNWNQKVLNLLSLVCGTLNTLCSTESKALQKFAEGSRFKRGITFACLSLLGNIND